MHLKLFGGASVRDGKGEVLELTSRRHPVALLALLATAPSRTLSRGKLVGYLWPETPEKTGRNRLNTYVHQVRAALGGDVLVSVGEELRMDTDALACDACRFEEALEEGDAATAVELYEGPFLDGFRLPGSPAFDHWLDRERERLRRGYREALETLAERAREQGDPAGAARWWRERADDDPYDSRVVHRLMEALDAAGNRAAALRAARDHARVLQEEFGTEPAEGVLALADTVSSPAGDVDPRSVAVLPFEELGASEEVGPFAAGLHGDLLTELARAGDLTVISRTSVLGFRGTGAPLRDVARQLGVATVVEGQVRRAGDQVRLAIQLSDARDGTLRWAESYDRELTAGNLFDLQTDLARRVVRTLRAELSPSERERLEREESPPAADRRPTESLEAYRLCSQGRWLLDQRSGDKLRRAVGYFRRAIDRDPEYALAWSGLADALSLLGFYAYAPPEDSPTAAEAARRAVELAPELAEARTSLGIVHSLRQEGPRALDELRRAVELSPGYAEAHAWLGWVRLLVGRPEGALASEARAAELNPLAPAFRAYHAEALLACGREERALEEARRAREIRPEYGLPHYVEGLVLHHLGRHGRAADAFEESLSRVPPRGTPSHPEVLAALIVTRAAAGEGTRELLRRLEEEDHPFSLGLARAALGDAEGAFEALGRVETWDAFAADHLRHFFPDVLGPLREDPRYDGLLRAADRGWGMDG